MRRPLDWLLWCVQGLLALEFAAVAWAKVSGMPEMVALFATIGVGQWFRYVTGILELTGAILIVVPRTRTIGAALLGAIMLGAIAVHLFLLHVPPTAPVVLFLLSGLVVWGRWKGPFRSGAGEPSIPRPALRGQAGEVRRSAVPRT